MATRYINKVPAANRVVSTPTARGIGYNVGGGILVGDLEGTITPFLDLSEIPDASLDTTTLDTAVGEVSVQPGSLDETFTVGASEVVEDANAETATFINGLLTGVS